VTTASSSASDSDTEGFSETEGLNCGDSYAIPQLADARVARVSDLTAPPAELDPNGYVLILSSQPSICSDPLGGFDCADANAYRLYLSLPADVMEDPDQQNGLEFGDTTDGTGGAPEVDIASWIQVGQTQECSELTTPPELGILYVESFDPQTLELEGRICNYYYTPELGHGLSGTFSTSPGCGG
jgi:hypothetical protein